MTLCNKNQFLLFIISILFISTSGAFGQNTSIKGMIIPAYYYNSISFGFEWKLSHHSYLDLLTQAKVNNIDSDKSNSNASYSIGYKYYIVDSTDKFLNNHWGGIYFIQLRESVSNCSEGGNFLANNLGLGVSIGKKIFLSKTKKAFLNIGFRGSCLYRNILRQEYCYEYEKKKAEDHYFYFRPEFLLNFGMKLKP